MSDIMMSFNMIDQYQNIVLSSSLQAFNLDMFCNFCYVVLFLMWHYWDDYGVRTESCLKYLLLQSFDTKHDSNLSKKIVVQGNVFGLNYVWFKGKYGNCYGTTSFAVLNTACMGNCGVETGVRNKYFVARALLMNSVHVIQDLELTQWHQLVN